MRAFEIGLGIVIAVLSAIVILNPITDSYPSSGSWGYFYL